MDQVKIGSFIKNLRKRKGYTQEQLANKLLVSPKTISKWECGNGMPEVSLMMSLCSELEITVNELLSGCHLDESEYKGKAEENLVMTLIEKKNNKLLLVIQIILGFLLILSVVSLVMLASLLPMETWLRIILLVLAVVMIIGGISCLIVLDVHTGYFKCSECKETFVPTIKEYVMSVHTFSKRKLSCPHCKRKQWCKKVTSKKEINKTQDNK